MTLLSWKIKRRYLRWIHRLTGDRFTGVGTLLAFHRITAEVERTWAANQHIESTPEFLEEAVCYLEREGFEFIPLAEVPARLRAATKPRQPRFASVTFDDGYRDTFATAYPILQRHRLPFTVYVTTHFIDRTAPIWWYLLEDRLATATELEVEHRGQRRRFRARTAEEKRAAFVALEAIFLSCSGAESAELARQLFGERSIEESCDRLMMTWDQVLELHRSGSVTIAAHTCRHLALGRLSPAEARAEILESRQELEARLRAPIHHLAFPFGSRGLAGPREARLARECGFATAASTRQANLFPQHLDHLHALPRVFPMSSAAADFPLVVSGAASAWRYRGRRVVTMD